MGSPDIPQLNKSNVSSAGKILRIVLLLAGIEGLVTVFLIGQTRSVEGGVLFGLSSFRLALAGLILLTSILLLLLTWRWQPRSRLANVLEQFFSVQRNWLILLLFWLGVLFFILWLEPYFQIFFAKLEVIDTDLFYQRLRPFLGWAALALTEFSIGIVVAFRVALRQQKQKQLPLIVWLVLRVLGWAKTGSWANTKDRFQQLWLNYRAIWLIWGSLISLWVVVAATRVGITPDDRFWNVAGIPLLPQQIILSCLVLLLLLDLKHRYSGKLGKFFKRPASTYLFIGVIWLGTFLFWQGADLKHTYFAPDPYPPNYARYPFSDARAFDLGGQALLQGFGLNNNITTDRPYLMTYIAFLHTIGGQDYDQYITIQVAFLALIPVLLFVLGWKLHSKTAGLGIALLMILQQGNAIRASAEIGLVNPKVLMSELPTALLLIGVTIAAANWLGRQQSIPYLSPVIAGGLLGLAVGFRGNVLILVPAMVLIALLRYLPKPMGLRHWAMTSALFSFCFILVLAPYSIRSTLQDGAPFWLTKIQESLERSTVESAEEVEDYRQPKLVDPARKNADANPFDQNLLTYSLNHFIHNEINSVLIFPLRWQVLPLELAVNHPIWDYDQDWQGELANQEKINLGVNLLILSLGIGFAVRHHGILGLLPLAIHLAYNLTNALTRKSGGRYLVPTEWVIILYFFLGIAALYYSLRGWQPAPKPVISSANKPLIKTGAAMTVFLMLGSSFLIADIIPNKHPANTLAERYSVVEEFGQEWISDSDFQLEEVIEFIDSEQGVLRIGLVLYPRFFPAGESPVRSSHVPPMPYEQNRVTFLIMENGRFEYIHLGLGSGRVSQFPHAVYGMVIGCQMDSFVDGIVFIPLTGNSAEVIEQADLILSCESP